MKTLPMFLVLSFLAVPALAAGEPKPAATASAAPSAAAAASASAAAVAATPDEDLRRETNAVGDLKDEITYRLSKAHRRFEKGPVADNLKEKISRALDRAESQIKDEQTRLESALNAPGLSSRDRLDRVHEEVVAVSKVSHVGAEEIEAVRTHDDDTEETLQAVSDEVDKISDRASEYADKLEEAIDSAAEEEQDTHGVGILKGPHGKTHVGVNSKDDKVEFGGSVEVKKDETVDSAVSFGGSVTVEGDVRGDAVAMGGTVHVVDGGHVHGDAVSMGGKVVIDDGGRVDGEKTSVGAGKFLAGVLPGISPQKTAETAGVSATARVGWAIIHGGAEFICFLVLGMFVLLLAPKRTLVVADAIEHQGLKSGGTGLLLAVVSVPLFILLCIIVVGIPLAILLYPAIAVATFFGYVALAMVIGRKIPSGVLPTQNAHFAIGAAIVVVVGMIPFLGWAIWATLGFFALGAVALTRFGTEKTGMPPDVLDVAA